MQTLRADVEKFKGSNITNSFEKWPIITHDQVALNIVKFVLTVEFAKVPMCQFVLLLNFSFVETEIIDAEISKHFSKGVIVNTIRELSHYVSRIFTSTKIDGNYRMILNLKTFTEFLKFKHCKQDSIEDALHLTTERCYFGSVDLKDAYYSIPIHKNYHRYLTFFCKKEKYQYTFLPNGISPAVRVVTKVLTPPFKYLRSKGDLSVKCIDDSLLMGETFEICFKNIRSTVVLRN